MGQERGGRQGTMGLPELVSPQLALTLSLGYCSGSGGREDYGCGGDIEEKEVV
ncbi:unnamed protein product [Dovyalis caffra]|uniref:Uncharacterized protein n=1 Tax=Dovyalis caffra TaxID=77055 RepID=A0AAV1QNI5_9ROSI|nr:unnamed protein product [Dovyalis caffra]